MALKLQYNKTFVQQLKKQLAVREKALPTLKSKETALRLEVKKASDKVLQLKEELNELLKKVGNADVLWHEFPPILKLVKTEVVRKNIAGVKIPILEEVSFETADISYFHRPAWIFWGADQLKMLVTRMIEIKIVEKQFEILNQARKKTTQKVNLYEKVQIPMFKEGLIRIKRYLEDEENLSKSAQKIVKARTTGEVAL